MAFRDFTFPEVRQALGLSLSETSLFADTPPATFRAEFAARIRKGLDLAQAINTEKARSEFIIAPVLLEVWESLNGSFGIFSGIQFDVDASRGLNGVCDFILTKLPRQMVLTTPLVAIVEAKNVDIHSGLGQCIAAMVAAQEFNRQAGTPFETLSGVVTTGDLWRFLQLRASEVTINFPEYTIADLGKIMGIFTHILRDSS